MPVQTRSKTIDSNTIDSNTIDSKTLKKETKKEIKKRKKQFTRERKSNQLQKNPIEHQEDHEDQEDQILVPKRLAKQVAQIQYHFEDRSVIFELDWDGEKALFTRPRLHVHNARRLHSLPTIWSPVLSGFRTI